MVGGSGVEEEQESYPCSSISLRVFTSGNMLMRGERRVASRLHKSSEQLRVEHVRFEGGAPYVLSCSRLSCADFTKRTWSLKVKSFAIWQRGLGVPRYPDACPQLQRAVAH